mgnify:CR=1 FL=1
MRIIKFLVLFISSILLLNMQMYAQNLGIGPDTFDPDPSAGVEMQFTNKGLLIPRVALTNTSSASPITSPANSLLVYNTATTGDVTPGYYYWTGSKWMRLLAIDDKPAWLLSGNAGTTAGTNFIGTTDDKDVVFKANSTEIMRITSKRYVGIGTAFPTAYPSGNSPTLLHIYDSGSSTTDFALLQLGAYKSSVNGKVGEINFHANIAATDRRTACIESYISNVSGSNVAGDLRFSTNNLGGCAERMRIDPNGNVGIGTTSPGSKLEIRGTADLTLRNDQTLSTSGDDLAVINLGDAYSGSQARILVERGTAGSGGDNPTDISFWNTPDGSDTLTERMRIMHNGNVGIGTTNPANKLHVEGTAQANRLYVGASSFTGGNQTVTDGFEDEGWGYGVPGYAATTISFTDRIGFRRVGGTFNRAYGGYSHSVSPHSGNYMISSMGYGSTSATSQVDFTFYMGAAGTFSIWYCISSEANYDYAYYYLDGGSGVSLGSGEGSWTQLSLSLAAGFHIISFRYDPDGWKVRRNDALFLDDLSITNVAIGATPADGDIWATGNIVAHTSAHIGDLAEYLPIKGFSKPGMVVSYCKGSDRSFKISDTPYDPYIAGVISTEPSILLNSPDAGYAVGFAGQVPVLVDGDIKGGDYLTSSSKPGYAMKADKAGKVIGFALENKKPDSETVLILIQPGYFVPLPSEEPKEKGLIPVDIDERKMTE